MTIDLEISVICLYQESYQLGTSRRSETWVNPASLTSRQIFQKMDILRHAHTFTAAKLSFEGFHQVHPSVGGGAVLGTILIWSS